MTQYFDIISSVPILPVLVGCFILAAIGLVRLVKWLDNRDEAIEVRVTARLEQTLKKLQEDYEALHKKYEDLRAEYETLRGDTESERLSWRSERDEDLRKISKAVHHLAAAVRLTDEVPASKLRIAILAELREAENALR